MCTTFRLKKCYFNIFYRMLSKVKFKIKNKNKMSNTYERYCIKKTLKLQHGVDLTDAQLDTIEEIYFESKKTNIANVMFYRAINFVIGFLGILFFLVMRNVEEKKWFFLAFVILFAIYNVIHLILEYVRYKRLKAPEKLADGN